MNEVEKRLEIIDIKTETNKNIRLILDNETNELRLIVDSDIQRACDQVEFQPIIEVETFGSPAD